MLTLRRGVTRIGWVLLIGWVAIFATLIATGTRSSDAGLTQPLATFVGVPFVIFLLWRLLLWIGQGFWQRPTTPPAAGIQSAPSAFHLPPEFWTIRTMSLGGAVLFAAYGVFVQCANLALGGDYAARVFGGLIAYAATGAIFGAVMARFLPR